MESHELQLYKLQLGKQTIKVPTPLFGPRPDFFPQFVRVDDSLPFLGLLSFFESRGHIFGQGSWVVHYGRLQEGRVEHFPFFVGPDMFHRPSVARMTGGGVAVDRNRRWIHLDGLRLTVFHGNGLPFLFSHGLCSAEVAVQARDGIPVDVLHWFVSRSFLLQPNLLDVFHLKVGRRCLTVAGGFRPRIQVVVLISVQVGVSEIASCLVAFPILPTTTNCFTSQSSGFVPI